ncbi:MAG: hypothetical protein KA473_03860 [Anaerolineales bacterium]|nr:hypothetical protein [Anaerolineales bacterium]MBP6208548.1 hypothetical protein [Anaerolineales bacterium]MBP8165188.1 hypothetical protein [Anaerolineales bacterium]
MNNIPKVSLEDSLYVLQLARETALAQNRQTQAKRMTPLVEEMRGLVANPPQTTTPPSTGVMGQSDFKTLLNISQEKVGQQNQSTDSITSVLERNRLIGAMSEANMSDVDIARQFSMSREEVQLVLSFQKNR